MHAELELLGERDLDLGVFSGRSKHANSLDAALRPADRQLFLAGSYGRNAYDITDVAHVRGSVNGKRPDFFRQAGIVVDVIDSRTNKLVFRGFAKGDVIKGASESTRSARIDAGVAQALAGFFR